MGFMKPIFGILAFDGLVDRLCSLTEMHWFFLLKFVFIPYHDIYMLFHNDPSSKEMPFFDSVKKLSKSQSKQLNNTFVFFKMKD